MCGIAGIRRFDGKKIGEEEIEKMTRILSHRGPDGQGTYLSPDETTALGHRRLSIIDLDERSAQPFRFEHLHLTYNGEIYNYLELRKELEDLKYSFSTSGDTEVLLKAFHAWGSACLEKLDGMFAFLIYNSKEQTFFAARDRFGEKPFYYCKDDDEFAFASEVKALATRKKPEVNEAAIYRYLIYDITANPDDQSETFFRNIFQLEPAHWMEVSANGSIQKHKYWWVKANATFSGSEAEAVTEFKRLFNEGIERRLRSDVPVGSSLSGGLDSSAIVANIMSGHREKMETFTARFDHADFDEGRYVDLLQARFGFQKNETWPQPKEWMEELEKVYYHQEEIFGSSSIYAQWKVMALAEERDITVLLDGQGGDELLAGYFKYFQSFLAGQFRKHPLKALAQRKKLKSELGIHFGIMQSLQMVSPHAFDLLRNSSLSGGSRKKMEKSLGSRLSTEIYVHKNPFHSYSNLNANLYFDCFQYGLNKLLRFADRNSMAFSREVRLPFLYHKLVEFAFSLPDELKIKIPWTKYILRRSMEEQVPEEVVWRKDKKGFAPPQSDWLNDPDTKKRVEKAEKNLIQREFINHGHSFDPWQILMVDQLIAFTEINFNKDA